MTTHSTATGPRTEAGKAVSSRNATPHGLFCRQTVLPHLGEDPEAYRHLLDTLKLQIRSRNLMKTQSVEHWADASWKLRRLSRLERLARLQNSLRRQMDRAVRALCRDLPDLFHRRNRVDIMEKMKLTETQARHSPILTDRLEHNIHANRRCPDPPDALLPRLDNIPPDADTPTVANCQNELPPAPASSLPRPALADPEGEGGGEKQARGGSSSAGGVLKPDAHENCQNELPSASSPAPPELGAGGAPLPPAAEMAVGAPLAAPGEPKGVQQHGICQNEPLPPAQPHSPAMSGPSPAQRGHPPGRQCLGWRSRGGGLLPPPLA